MTDSRARSGPDAARPPGSRDTLGRRLARSEIGVALVAVALLTALIATFAAADVSSLVRRQRGDLTAAISAAAAVGWSRHDSWTGADLSPALELASRTGAETQISDASGRKIVASGGFAAEAGKPQFSAPVMLHGRRLGEAVVRFTSAGLNSADHALRVALALAVATAAALAALVALLTGLAVARHLARPVARIVSVTRAMGRGQRGARVGTVRAPGELQELATAFDEMADRLDRNEQVRRNLVADVAHELRTPVAVLQAGHEAILDGLAEPTPGELSSLRDEVLRLARMVEDLQLLAAADSAALELSRNPCDLAEIAATAADSLAGRFAAAGITLQRSAEPAPILGDPRWLHQVVTNLLTNALKFSRPGGTVSTACGPAGSQAVLHVTDNGVGIRAEDLPRIFDRFWRGRPALGTSGSGIGLAIAAELAIAHGGSLAAASEPGHRTELTLTLPLAST